MLRRVRPVGPIFDSDTAVAHDEEDIERVEDTMTTRPRSFKVLLESNQVAVSLLQYASTACVMFLPANFRYYEMAAEGCYSVSQLIQYFNRTIIDSTLEKCAKLEDFCVLVTRGISHVEVLIEKGADALMGLHGRTQAVMVVEVVKSLLRLLILLNRRAPSLLIHWERDRRPDSPKLDMAHYSRWYRLAYAHHQSNGRSTDEILDGHRDHHRVTELPPLIAAADAHYSSNQLHQSSDEHISGNGKYAQGGGDTRIATDPIVGRRSGINIPRLIIPVQQGQGQSMNMVDHHPDYGIYNNLSHDGGLPLARPVQPTATLTSRRRSRSSGDDEDGDGDGGDGGHSDDDPPATPRADTDGGFRYLPHSIGPHEQAQQRSVFADEDNNGEEETSADECDGDSTDNKERGGDRTSKVAQPSSGFFSFFQRGTNRGGNDSDVSSDSGVGDACSEGGDSHDDTFDRDMYMSLGNAEGRGAAGSQEGREDEEEATTDEDEEGRGLGLKPKKITEDAESGPVTAATGSCASAATEEGGTGGTHTYTTAPANDTLSSEHYIYLGEVLYVLRPALYAWAVHFVGGLQRGRDNDEASSSSSSSSSPYFATTAATATGGAYDDDDDEAAWAPAAASTPVPVPSPSRSVKSEGSGAAADATRPGAHRYVPTFQVCLSRYPVLAQYIASDGQELQRAVAVLVSFLVEVLSVQLTARGLLLSREKGARAYHTSQAAQQSSAAASHHTATTAARQSSSKSSQDAALKAIQTAFPHEFDAELSRRRMALFFYLIRSPVFDRATLPLLQLASRLLSRVPLISSLPEHVVSMLSYLNRTHFYSAASN